MIAAMQASHCQETHCIRNEWHALGLLLRSQVQCLRIVLELIKALLRVAGFWEPLE